jgi:hypothetical protein
VLLSATTALVKAAEFSPSITQNLTRGGATATLTGQSSTS